MGSRKGGAVGGVKEGRSSRWGYGSAEEPVSLQVHMYIQYRKSMSIYAECTVQEWHLA